jgi:hypothetical protein
MYQKKIRKLFPKYNSRHVEAWMRLGNKNLNKLSTDKFRQEATFAVLCTIEEGAKRSEKLAEVFKL